MYELLYLYLVMNDELYEKLYEEGLKLFRDYQSRPKGQQITSKDNIDYWLIMVAYNRGCNDGYEQYLNDIWGRE